jgi:nucleoside-diphosphate-sugar epimerase
MTPAPPPLVAITGASGYLGSVLVGTFEKAGYAVRRLVRSPRPGSPDRVFDLAGPPSPGSLEDVDLLVHCAYDMTLTRRADIWEANVFGSIALFDDALANGVGRTITLSSMSAYPGTGQHYGRAKLAVEGAARERGICVIRPGLVYGPEWGGMAGTLRRLASLPVVPDFGPRARQFTVDERDFASAVLALARSGQTTSRPAGIAHPEPVPFTELIAAFADSAGKRPPRFVRTPSMAVYGALRVAELLPLRLPVRADSLLGLVRPAPMVPNIDILDGLGVTLRPFTPADLRPGTLPTDASESGAR